MYDVYNIKHVTGTDRIKVAKGAVKNYFYATLFFHLDDHESSSSSCHTRYCLLNYLSNITIRIRLRQKFTHCLGWDLEHRKLHDNDIYTTKRQGAITTQHAGRCDES
jgi:hypothetical protein